MSGLIEQAFLAQLDLEAAGARSTAEGDQVPDDIRWIPSYVVEEIDGALGTVWVYADNSEAQVRSS